MTIKVKSSGVVAMGKFRVQICRCREGPEALMRSTGLSQGLANHSLKDQFSFLFLYGPQPENDLYTF